MPSITFLPLNKTIEVKKGETILDSAINQDIPLQHACGGFCACTTCHVLVKSGAENLSPMEEMEQDRLEEVGCMTPNSRLSCQTQVLGDVVLEIVNLE